MDMRIGPAGLALIKRFEGFREAAYLDGNGVPTIGYGHTRGVRLGQHVSLAEADRLLLGDIAEAEDMVNVAVVCPRGLGQNQFDAMTSIMFNVGPGEAGVRDGIVTLKSGRASTLLRKLNAGDFQGAADEFPKWDHDGGVEVRGLKRRRLAERELFLTPDDGPFASLKAAA